MEHFRAARDEKRGGTDFPGAEGENRMLMVWGIVVGTTNEMSR